jgi:dTDP-glucose pyrophosphorylase
MEVNHRYMQMNKLHVVQLGPGCAWFDWEHMTRCRRHPSSFARFRAGRSFPVGCPEEIAYFLGFIDADQVQALAAKYERSSYGRYLGRLVSANAEKMLERTEMTTRVIAASNNRCALYERVECGGVGASQTR